MHATDIFQMWNKVRLLFNFMVQITKTSFYVCQYDLTLNSTGWYGKSCRAAGSLTTIDCESVLVLKILHLCGLPIGRLCKVFKYSQRELNSNEGHTEVEVTEGV